MKNLNIRVWHRPERRWMAEGSDEMIRAIINRDNPAGINLAIDASDRYGSEIYVDDIVNVLPDHYDKYLIDSNPWVIKKHGASYVLLKRLNAMGDITARELPNTYFLEVIGNIYENPELLDGEG